jgi:hypothetical protein
MRIVQPKDDRGLAEYVDPISGHTYAVICNPIADEDAYRFRLICAQIKDWKKKVDTTRSVSRTQGILIYVKLKVPNSEMNSEDTKARVAALIREARVLGGAHHLVSDRRTP